MEQKYGILFDWVPQIQIIVLILKDLNISIALRQVRVVWGVRCRVCLALLSFCFLLSAVVCRCVWVGAGGWPASDSGGCGAPSALGRSQHQPVLKLARAFLARESEMLPHLQSGSLSGNARIGPRNRGWQTRMPVSARACFLREGCSMSSDIPSGPLQPRRVLCPCATISRGETQRAVSHHLCYFI